MQDSKKCSKCSRTLVITEFYKIKSGTSTRSDCKQCNKESHLKYLENNRAKVLAKKKEYRLKNPGKVKNDRKIRLQKEIELKKKYKESKPCSDCGRYYPYYVMDFDHKDPNTKIGNPFSLREDLIEQEILKCDLVCANCHRIRTHNNGHYNYKKNRV
jgi:hypothetical protein